MDVSMCRIHHINVFITLLQCKVVIRSVFAFEDNSQTCIHIYASAIHLFFQNHGWYNYLNGNPQTKWKAPLPPIKKQWNTATVNIIQTLGVIVLSMLL